MEKNDNGGFNVHVYSPGNMFANNITFEAPVYIGGGNNLSQQHGFTDEQIARAIEAICGEDKPLCEKRLWAAVYWCLRWYCNFPVKGSEFCDRIEKLPFSKKLDPGCCYENIRKLVTLSFMSLDCRNMETVKPSRVDEDFFAQCRVVVLALTQELGKTTFPKP